MIFVTVGSMAPFDELIMKVDKLAENRVISDVMVQIGNGSYIPKNTEWFRFKDNLKPFFQSAEFIITHNGAGTLFEILSVGKKAIAVSNPHTIQLQNLDIMIKLSKEGYILSSQDLDHLEESVSQIKNWTPKEYKEPPCRIHEEIAKYLLGPSK
jgi:beta-1,4-N-acetylglucosaminyltransferase